MLYKDIRMVDVRKIISGAVAKRDLDNTTIYVKNNVVLLLVRDTILIVSQLLPDFDTNNPTEICCRYSDICNLNDDEYIDSYFLLKEARSLYCYYIESIDMYPRVAFDPDLRSDPEFEKLLSLKSADGAKFYKLRDINYNIPYFIPVFSGFPNLNKPDKIGASVRDLMDGDHLLIELDIFKKKIKRNIKIIYRTLDLMKPQFGGDK